MTEQKHSPTPWHDSLDINSIILYDSKNRKVVLTEENIRFIVKAANGHDKLVKACRAVYNYFDSGLSEAEQILFEQLDRALADAEEK